VSDTIKQLPYEVHYDLFTGLNRVAEAAYNSSAREFATGCLEGTRVDVLRNIHDWIRTDGTSLFWLNGVAGTGKSTIAHSIAQACDLQGSLGASFFFSRDQQARRETRFLFQTIAFQLGCAHPALKLHIANALEDQSILTSNSRRQFQQLILEPIFRIKDSFSSPIVVVLDALDECEEEAAVSHVIQLLASELKNRNIPLKFFVTSRPETHIRFIFQSPQTGSNTHQFVLHDVEPSHVQHDIQAFVQHELRRIADLCLPRQERNSWPKEDEVNDLVRISAGLFIAAATAIRFINPIRGSRDPRPRLRMILDSARTISVNQVNPFKELDMVYTQVLEHALCKEQALDPHILEHFRTILGTIVLAYGRLTANELEGLLQLEGKVRSALAELHSVILVREEDSPVHAFHLSFHDYLTNGSRCGNPNFFIDTSAHHGEIARLCLERMKRSLKRDICEIRDPTRMNDEIGDLSNRTGEYLPGDLQYACRYWAMHLSQCSSIGFLFNLLRNFVFGSVLHWLEVLSLIGKLGDGLKSLKDARVKLAVSFVLRPCV
jgi:NACHT domain